MSKYTELEQYVFDCWRSGLKTKEILEGNPLLTEESLQYTMKDVMNRHFTGA